MIEQVSKFKDRPTEMIQLEQKRKKDLKMIILTS